MEKRAVTDVKGATRSSDLAALDMLSKFAVLSHILPPSPSGQATVLSRLLGTVPPDKYCLISNENAEARRQDDNEGLPTAYFLLPPERELKRPNRFGLSHWRQSANLWWRARQRARAIAEIVRAEGCNALVACSGDVINIPAGCLASRWAGVRFFVYLFDDYVYQWTDPLYRSFAKRGEATAVKNAAAVITPNEFARDEYQRRYGIEPVIIRNPMLDQGQSAVVEGDSAAAGDVRIVYTGAVYHATGEALRNLVQAIARLDQPAMQLHIYSSQPKSVLNDFDLRGPLAYHNHVTPGEAENTQRDADILFLPLSFNSGIPEVIRTAAPVKMGEYLASGRPIIAHAPPDSFVSWYFRKHDCGILVDQNEPDALAEAIERLLADDQLRGTISENARKRAQIDFSLALAQATFLDLLKQ
jgi:glycosyltransferase involved in cell wall biosynthesis